MIISVDIGTSYSSLSILGPEGKAVPVDISTGASMFGDKYSLPTAVYADQDGRLLVGQAAMNSRQIAPQNFRMEFKRNLGQNVPILLGEKSFLPEDFYAEIFRHMKAQAEKASNDEIQQVYLTCPASYGRDQKQKLKDAAKAAGLFQPELVDEPTAAAMSYAADGCLRDGETLLIYDFGGGTFDASLLKYEHGSFILLTEPEGLEHCGGIDMDRAIFQDMLKLVDPATLGMLKQNELMLLRFTGQLEELAIQAKHHLSSAESYRGSIPVGFDIISYELTRERFNQMIASQIGKTIEVCRHILEQAKIKPEDLSAVLLVGGTCRIPLVQDMVRQFAGDVPVRCARNLELAVVQGAINFRNYKMGLSAAEENSPSEKPKTVSEELCPAAPKPEGFSENPLLLHRQTVSDAAEARPTVFHGRIWKLEAREIRTLVNKHLTYAGVDLTDEYCHRSCYPKMAYQMHLTDNSEILFGCDGTVFHSGKYGLLLTTKSVYISGHMDAAMLFSRRFLQIPWDVFPTVKISWDLEDRDPCLYFRYPGDSSESVKILIYDDHNRPRIGQALKSIQQDLRKRGV